MKTTDETKPKTLLELQIEALSKRRVRLPQWAKDYARVARKRVQGNFADKFVLCCGGPFQGNSLAVWRATPRIFPKSHYVSRQ
ncbi:MAG: hypothetical protein LAQ30_25320 [Acidobacteriia bacterium]|nr:hypothetical protein [Terriglobia bacterium]